jgi:hypothetical protein
VFNKKIRFDCTIDKYKARLVAKVYAQNKVNTFFDIYSPVDSMTMNHVLLPVTIDCLVWSSSPSNRREDDFP